MTKVLAAALTAVALLAAAPTAAADTKTCTGKCNTQTEGRGQARNHNPAHDTPRCQFHLFRR